MQEKFQIKILILSFRHGMFLHIYGISPGSGLVSLHTDPDPTFIIQIRIRITDFFNGKIVYQS